MSFIRAALVSVALVAVGALAAGCGSDSGTTVADQPAAVASVQVTTPVTPQPTPQSTPTPASAPTSAPTTRKATKPVATTKEVVEFRTIPFKKKTVTDDSLAKGEKTVRTAGVNGTRRMTYRVTIVNGIQTGKHLLSQEVAKQPRTQITAVGTKVDEPESSGCDPNYSGCVPIASDVDCSGGSGNGPEYVDGPVDVIGSDIYRLDADHDGVGCE
ncbi:G5 domain-containing protein [Kribbella kalugense]|uniref:Surface rod structure-forming protein G n=1 Tax=Kribbella kalugense TaxID=2512221 RepID=A0A4R7ZQQ8_9ACTN|nr:G5 domain-containing protein [Kribbella kalugense]TDW18938.1 surface rod structure-forming protein G [Kribbella kalugense]